MTSFCAQNDGIEARSFDVNASKKRRIRTLFASVDIAARILSAFGLTDYLSDKAQALSRHLMLNLVKGRIEIPDWGKSGTVIEIGVTPWNSVFALTYSP